VSQSILLSGPGLCNSSISLALTLLTIYMYVDSLIPVGL